MAAGHEFVSDVILKDGSLVEVRPAVPEDKGEMLAFAGSLSRETLRMRFLGELSDPAQISQWLDAAPHRFVLVALHEGRIIGHCAYQETTHGRAEWSLVIRDDMQRKGIGTLLIGQLTEAAAEAGIYSLAADVSTENYAMLDVIRGLGFPVKYAIDAGALHLSHPTSISPTVLELFDRMETHSAAAGVERFLSPGSIAVIGASRNRGTIGGELFHNCLAGGFNGPVYPVNPTAAVVQSVPAYKSVRDCPGPVDLAIITVRAELVLPAARDCATKGVKALVVISAGFSEAGPAGVKLQQELVQVCRESGMRIVGPNCMGLVNTAPNVQLNAQFSRFPPMRGSLGILSQSGAVGLALIEYSGRMGHGVSSFISVGNKADVSGNDLLQYWEGDDRTHLILLYLESFGNARKFSRIARRVSRTKPIIAVKGGRSAAGFRATQSHTGAMVSSSLASVDALFGQAGVIRVDTLEQMFDVATLLSSQPPPRGNRVAILTNAGGAGILAADACEDTGLAVPELSSETQGKLRKFLNPDASVRNPVDMVASASPANYEMAIQAISEDPGIDSLISIFIPPLNAGPDEVVASVLRSAHVLRGKMPILAVLMASRNLPVVLADGPVSVPNFSFPEAAVRALSKASHYGRWLNTPAEEPVILRDVKRGEALGLVARALREGREWLTPEETLQVLTCYGIPSLEQAVAADAESAASAVKRWSGRVVLKAIAPGLVHKSDVGGVVTGLEGEEAVRKAAREMQSKLEGQGFKLTGFLVQPMAEGGLEMFLGITHDVTFGPILACGAGGVLVELLKDVEVCLTPVTRGEAHERLQGLRTYPLLKGYRGQPKRDIAALEDAVVRVSALADEIHEILEMDLNPLMVMPEGQGVRVVDARIRIGHPPREIPLGAKKLAPG